MYFIDKAKQVIKERGKKYSPNCGDPYLVFMKTAAYWSVLFGVKVSGAEVAKAMMLFKMARENVGSYDEDNYVDMIGYTELLGKMKQHYRGEKG